MAPDGMLEDPVADLDVNWLYGPCILTYSRLKKKKKEPLLALGFHQRLSQFFVFAVPSVAVPHRWYICAILRNHTELTPKIVLSVTV